MLTDQELLLPEAPIVRPSRRFNAAPTLHRIAFWCIILNIAVAALIAGLLLRRFAWDQTEPIRFLFDIDNAFAQGSMTLREGYLARYTNQESNNGDYDFDYAPGRPRRCNPLDALGCAEPSTAPETNSMSPNGRERSTKKLARWIHARSGENM